MKSFDSLRNELERSWSVEKSQRLMREMCTLDPHRALDELSLILIQGDPELKPEALELLIGLSQSDEEGIRRLFFSILQDPLSWELRAPILKALLYRLPGQAKTREVLLKLLHSQDWDLVAHIIQALGPLADPELQSWLADCLKHPHYFVRKRAVEALGAQPWSPEVENYLLSMLSDTQSEVVLKVLHTLSNASSYRVMSQIRDLLTLPQTPPELKPVLLETADSIAQHLNALLQSPPEQMTAADLHALTVWLRDEPHAETYERLLPIIRQGIDQIYRLTRPEQIALLKELLALPPERGATLYPQILRWSLKLQSLALPESMPLELKQELENLLLEQSEAERLPSEQEQAFYLLGRYGGKTALKHLREFLDAPPQRFVQILPLMLRFAEESVDQLLHFSLHSLAPHAQENILLFLEGLQHTQGVPLALRLLKQNPQRDLQPRLRHLLLSYGPLLLPALLKELERSQDSDFISLGLVLIQELPPSEDSLKCLLQILIQGSPENRESAALGLIRLKAGTQSLWRICSQDKVEQQTRELALEILLGRSPENLPELLMLPVTPETLELWQDLIAEILTTHLPHLSLQEVSTSLLQAPTENRRHMLELLQSHHAVEWAELLFPLLCDPELSEATQSLLQNWGPLILEPLLHWGLADAEHEKAVLSLLTQFPSSLLQIRLQNTPHVQAKVLLVQALLKQGFVAGQEYLWELLPLSPRPLQLALLESLGQVQEGLRWKPLLSLLKEEQELQLASLKLLAYCPTTEVIQAVENCLESPISAIRCQALETLGQLQAPQLLPRLEAYLKQAEAQSDSALRNACLSALGTLTEPEAESLLLTKLNAQAGLADNRPVLEALAKRRTEQAIQQMIVFFETVTDLPQQCLTVEMLGSSHQPQALNYLLENLNQWDLPLQRAAIRSLAKTAEKWLIPAFEKLLQSALDWRLQRTLLEELHRFPHMEALRLLKSCLDAYPAPTLRDWLLRQALQQSLQKLRQRSVSET